MQEKHAVAANAPRSKKIWIWSAVLFIIVLLVVWRLFSQFDGERQAKRSPPLITAATAVSRDMTVFVSALGTVTPNNTVVVHSRVDGQLMRLGFTEGQMVKQGQILAELDPRPFEVALTQAQGQLARDQALLNNAELDLQRYRTLLAQNSISQQQVATQQALVQQYRGNVMSDRGAVDNARLQLTYSRVSAPVSGRVGLKQVDVGNIVHASDTNGLVVITQMQPVNVLFSLPQDNIDAILAQLNQHVVLPVEAWDRENQHKLATGQLMTVDNQVDSTTGTVKLKASFKNVDNGLFPKQFVNVRLGAEQRKQAVVIPLAALQRGQPGTFVYLIKPDHTVTLRVIEPGPSQGDQLIVNRGLQAGDQVALDGVDRLREGSKVTVVSPNDQLAAQASAGQHKKHVASGAR